MNNNVFDNPFRPGAGHKPPYLAGRESETDEFKKLLTQRTILENMVLTGLRGVGKTVMLDTFKPLAIKDNWLWIGTDLSESSTISEENLVIRLLTDLSVVTSNIIINESELTKIGFLSKNLTIEQRLNYDTLIQMYKLIPGLASDKLKAILEFAWVRINKQNKKGLIFAYDEAQNLGDRAEKEQYPLSLILDVFQSIQKKDIPFMLVLTGLPTLFPKLVDARTFAERMFRVIFLDKLSDSESEQAITKPLESIDIRRCPVEINDTAVKTIVNLSGGYPYFIQFFGREVYDYILQEYTIGAKQGSIPFPAIVHKLDTDFFAGRWSRTTDRQRDLLLLAAFLLNENQEFTVQDIVDRSSVENATKSFSNSHVNQMLLTLSKAGLIYKNRHGKYSFAVPMLAEYILRHNDDGN